MREIKFSGSVMVPEDIDLHDAGTAVVMWECTAIGRKSSASKGDYDTSNLKTLEAIVLSGTESAKFEERIRSDADRRDLQVVQDVE